MLGTGMGTRSVLPRWGLAKLVRPPITAPGLAIRRGYSGDRQGCLRPGDEDTDPAAKEFTGGLRTETGHPKNSPRSVLASSEWRPFPLWRCPPCGESLDWLAALTRWTRRALGMGPARAPTDSQEARLCEVHEWLVRERPRALRRPLRHA